MAAVYHVSTENGWKIVPLRNVRRINSNRLRLKRLIPVEHDLRSGDLRLWCRHDHDPPHHDFLQKSTLLHVHVTLDCGIVFDLTCWRLISDSPQAPSERARLYFLLAWFHAIVQERLRYVPLGWSKRYEFSESDLRVACDTLDTWLDSVAQVCDN